MFTLIFWHIIAEMHQDKFPQFGAIKFAHERLDFELPTGPISELISFQTTFYSFL
jgi:hypothetical protein